MATRSVINHTSTVIREDVMRCSQIFSALCALVAVGCGPSSITLDVSEGEPDGVPSGDTGSTTDPGTNPEPDPEPDPEPFEWEGSYSGTAEI